MKTISKFLVASSVLFFLATTLSIAQTKHSCCSIPSTQEFAMLGKDKSFAASHLSPLPFEYVSEKGKTITLKTTDGKDANAFMVAAEKPTENYLFVIHEWWGLNDYIKQESEKIQNELGNVNVIALDLYDGRVATNADDASSYMSETKDERIQTIIKAAIAFAGSKAKIQSIGWCFGGGWSLQTSIMAGKQGVGCVMYYGMPETQNEKIKSLNAPVLGLFASKDAWINAKLVKQFEKDMKANGKTLTVKTFEADHAFANPSNPHFDKVAAAAAHKLAIAFLKAHL